jgi:DhnA family fructose-bisphosphate aldolase class Ia
MLETDYRTLLNQADKFGRAIQAVFQVPVTASGGPKLDTKATAAQYPELEGLSDALQGANGLSPLVMPPIK